MWRRRGRHRRGAKRGREKEGKMNGDRSKMWKRAPLSFSVRNIRGGQEREAERRTGTSRFPQEQQVNIIHWLPIMSSDKSSGGRRRVGMRTVSCVLYPDYINSRNEASKKCEQISRGWQDRNLEQQRESFLNLFISCIHLVKRTTGEGKPGRWQDEPSFSHIQADQSESLLPLVPK